MRYLLILICVILVSCVAPVSVSGDRYIVLSPEIAELLYFFGVSDKIVGVTAECDYPTTLGEKEIVGNFSSVNYEKIITLNPSIVFTSGLEQDDITTQLEKLNIRTERFYPTNISDITSIIKELGDILHEETKADSLYNYFNDKFNEFKDRIELMDYKPNVYVEIYGDPIMTASNDAYLGELLAYSGGNNVFPVLPRDYCRISPEEVVKANPDIIIITYPGVSVDDICNRKGWNNISAVKNKKIYTVYDINPDLILRAGLRNVEGVERLQELLEIK